MNLKSLSLLNALALTAILSTSVGCGDDVGQHIDAGTMTLGLDQARDFDILAGDTGGVYGKVVGTGGPICFVVDADVDFVMEAGLASKWEDTSLDEPLGSFRDSECRHDAADSSPDFCWVRTVEGTEYAFIAERYSSADTSSNATVAIVGGPCPQEVDEAVFDYDGETQGDEAWRNQQVQRISLQEGLQNAATFAFDPEGEDVNGGFSATFTAPGGPVCFALDADIDGLLVVARKDRMTTEADSATIGEVPQEHRLCRADASDSSPDFCGLADTVAGQELIILGASYGNNDPAMYATLAAVAGACPKEIDEAVFDFDGETLGDSTFRNQQVVTGAIAATGAGSAIEAELDAEGSHDSGSVNGGISATYVADASATRCVVVDCDSDCLVEVALESELTTQPSAVTVGELNSSAASYCREDASAGDPDVCEVAMQSSETYRILGKSYSSGAAATSMAVAVIDGPCSSVDESTLTFDGM